MEPTFRKQAILVLRLGPRNSFQWEAELLANLVENPEKELINVSFGNVGTMTFMYTDNPIELVHANLNREYAERNLPFACMIFVLEDGYAFMNLTGNPAFNKIVQDFKDQCGITDRDQQKNDEHICTVDTMTSDDILDLAISQFDRDITKMPQVYQDRLKKLNS